MKSALLGSAEKLAGAGVQFCEAKPMPCKAVRKVASSLAKLRRKAVSDKCRNSQCEQDKLLINRPVCIRARVVFILLKSYQSRFGPGFLKNLLWFFETPTVSIPFFNELFR